MKNFFVKDAKQAKALEKSVENFGKQEISFLDNVVGGKVPTGGHYPYAESTGVFLRIPPPPPTGGG